MTSAVTHTVNSADGTRIAYLQQGHWPGGALVQGAMADVSAYRDLATALSSTHTVYSLERRGRGLSPLPYTPDHDIARDVDDIDAVLTATEATTVFGLSSGAIITLEAARTLTKITRAAIYEPPFYPAGIDHDGIQRLNQAIERGDLPTALIDALLTAGTAPTLLRATPRPVSHLLARLILTVDSRTRTTGAALRDLLPGVRSTSTMSPAGTVRSTATHR